MGSFLPCPSRREMTPVKRMILAIKSEIYKWYIVIFKKRHISVIILLLELFYISFEAVAGYW